MARGSSPTKPTRLWLGGLLMMVSATASAGAPGGGAAPQPMLLDVTLNGQSMGDPWMVLREGDGRAWLDPEDLSRGGVALPACDPLHYDERTFCRVDALAAMKLVFSDAEQRLAIDADPALFARQTANLSPLRGGALTAPGAGVFLNYDLLAEAARGDTRFSGAVEAGLYTPHGVGTATFVTSAGAGQIDLLRLETSWTTDRPDSLSSIRLGDAVSRGGPHTAPIRFAGIQYARNFAVQPGFVTMPLPSVEGSAAVPSVVDIYVNNSIRGSRNLAPGPFELTNVPVNSGGGRVEIVTRDLLGREVVTSRSYYTSTSMLQRGLHDFSYQIGFERLDFGYKNNSYGALTASATHRYGVSDSVTAEGHVQASRDRQSASGAVTAAWANIGLVSLSAAASHGRSGAGTAFGAAFERRTGGLSLGLRSEVTSGRYSYAGLPRDYEIPRLTAQAFADMPLGPATIGVNYLHRDFRHRPDESLVGAFASLGLGRAGAIQFYARHAAFGDAQTSLGASFVMPLGGRRSASAGYELSNGRSLASATFQSSPPSGVGGGFRIAATAGAVDGLDAEYRLQTSRAAFGVQAAHVEGRTGVRLSMAGALGSVGGDVFASRTLGDSFATIDVGGHKGVRVYADNQLIGRTGADGRIVVPALRAYEDNRIRIDEADLPLDVQIAGNEVNVRPYARSGALVRFEAKSQRGVLLRVAREDGSDLPAGSEAGLDGEEMRYPVATGGEIYVPGLTGTRRFRVRTDAGACFFEVTVPEDDDPQPRIDGLICRGATQYVAR